MGEAANLADICLQELNAHQTAYLQLKNKISEEAVIKLNVIVASFKHDWKNKGTKELFKDLETYPGRVNTEIDEITALELELELSSMLDVVIKGPINPAHSAAHCRHTSVSTFNINVCDAWAVDP